MQLSFTPQRSERKVDYELNGSILTIKENGKSVTVDLNNLPSDHNYPVVSVDGNTVTVIRFYDGNEKNEFEQ